MQINTEELDGLLLLVVLKSLLMLSYAQWKLSKSECKPLNQEHLQQVELQHSTKLNQMKVYSLIILGINGLYKGLGPLWAR